MAEHLKAVILKTDDGERLFINGTEMPWPIHPWSLMAWWPGADDKMVLALEIVVDDVVLKEGRSGR